MQYVKVDWLDSANSTGPTDPEQVQGASRYGVFYTSTGSPDVATVVLEGSVDRVNWFRLCKPPDNFVGVIYWSDSDEDPYSGPTRPVAGPVTYLRLNLTALSGGSSPTISATVIATD